MNHYGPWLDTLPPNPPHGSLWQAEAGPRRFECVVLLDWVYGWDREGWNVKIPFDEMTGCIDKARVRRVYPAGSVVPEPRPLTEELIRACWGSHTNHLMVTTAKETGDDWQYLACHQALELYNEWDKLWGYQAESVEINGVLTVVAVPWFDQLGDSE